ncbi:class I SAM-dependent methyltransferase [Actinomadura sp. HBU206391]|uniref:class I SAM-dependent methyltransferase n=1 Tax=Actinomadura sp. HBU206391 TaxID=2731692 RepID=UPI00164EEB60|nr:methyltransferase domain-containing protein [Actinomadura sp. HBU206391]MBC6456841.1 class I SAM-dependent methyltransferase [Actinomadura sp. HBU206391]
MVDSPTQIRAGDRFAFGSNWREFIELVDEPRIATAVDSLVRALGTTDLSDRTFLDVGCGSGLFSLAAHRLGARVRSFDFDPESVAATVELRERFAPGSDWTITEGSILDERTTAGLGRFDIVYSWGVLHHTGDLWGALDAVSRMVGPGCLLYISIYNDQGIESRLWRRVKRRYNKSGPLMRRALVAASAAYLGRHVPLRRAVRLIRPGGRRPAARPRARGMSARHDLVDWVGGYPFEVAKPEQVFSFLRERGYELRHLKTCAGGLGCNEYVFENTAPHAPV